MWSSPAASELTRVVLVDCTWVKGGWWPMTHPEVDPLGADAHVQMQSDFRAVQEQDQQLVEAQRLAHLGSWTWDVVSGEVTWSDELYRIFGVNIQEFTHRL